MISRRRGRSSGWVASRRTAPLSYALWHVRPKIVFKAGTDVMHRLRDRIDDPEDLFDVVGQLTELLFAFAQRVLREFLLGHVAEARPNAQILALAIVDRLPGRGGPDRRARLVQESEDDTVAHRAIPHGLLEQPVDDRHVVSMDQAVSIVGRRDGFVHRVARHALDRLARPEQHAVRVVPHLAGKRIIGDGVKHRFAGAKYSLRRFGIAGPGAILVHWGQQPSRW